MIWILEDSARAELKRHYEFLKSRTPVTDSDTANVDPLLGPRDIMGEPDSNGVVEIAINGILLNGDGWFYDWLGIGYTSYEDIRKSISQAEGDPYVSKIMLRIDSPGGLYDGMIETCDRIRQARKPVEAITMGMCASAAFILASQCDKISAFDRSSQIGGLGVAYDIFLDEREIGIANTDSPKKRPDLTTEEGRNILREELDELFDLIVGMVAQGRAQDEENVRKQYGQGRVMLANNALKSGMIDAVGEGVKREGDNMPGAIDENKIWADAYAKGQADERTRVMGHLKLGMGVGAMDLAEKGIREGTSTLNEEFQSGYLLAGLEKKNLENAKADEQDVADALPDSRPPAGKNQADTDAEYIADRMERRVSARKRGRLNAANRQHDRDMTALAPEGR